MTDVSLAMKKLAQKVRAEYEEIRDLAKPRTELKRKENPGVSPSGGSRSGVTPQKKRRQALEFRRRNATIETTLNNNAAMTAA